MISKISILALAATGLAALPATVAQASSVVLEVSGPLGGLALLGPVTGYNTSATTFTVNQDLTNAEIGMTIACYDSCAGQVFLYSTAPTPNAAAKDLQAIEDFAGPAGKTPAHDLAGIITTGRAPGPLTLFAGLTYTLILQVQQGGAAWYASGAPAFDDTYITPGPGYISHPSGQSNEIEYPFVPLADLGFNPLLYTISGDPVVAPVPLPASLPLVLAGLAALAGLRLRRRFQ